MARDLESQLAAVERIAQVYNDCSLWQDDKLLALSRARSVVRASAVLQATSITFTHALCSFSVGVRVSGCFLFAQLRSTIHAALRAVLRVVFVARRGA